MHPRCLLTALFLAASPALHAAPHDGWSPATVPADTPPASEPGFTWLRTYVHVPAGWQGSRLLLVAGGIDTVDEAFFNGHKIGANGAMPPLFAKPASDIRRPFVIEPDQVHFGAANLIAWRLYKKDAPPALETGPVHLSRKDDAIDLAGTWLAKAGDNPAHATWHTADHDAEAQAFRVVAGENHAGHRGVVPADKEGREKMIHAVYERFKNNPNPYAKHDDKGDPLPPDQALAKLKTPPGLTLETVLHEPTITQPLYIDFDERGRLWLSQYIQYPDPAGLEVLTWDKHLRKVFDQVPPPPPFDTPAKQKFRGRDVLSVHEDTDGDGTFDTHKTVLDGLNMLTSTARGRGGLWVLQPPYLLFYPDADNDDVPDAAPVVHLSGFGLEDTHSISNSLKWGPDGWLYGATGSTVTARVRAHLSGDPEPLAFFGQNIWRYHPEDHRFELFAEGGWNTFGVDFDDKGRLYSGTNGTQQAVYFVQGGYYQKSFGKHGPHTNPYTFGHFYGLPIEGERTRLVHQWVLYGGGSIPQLDGHFVGGNSLGSKLHALQITADGSTFKTREIANPVTSSDQWFRPVHLAAGPGGHLYIADFYDARITHVDPRDNWDRDRGRVYRLRSSSSKPTKPEDMGALSSGALVDRLASPDRWVRRTAQRLLADRKDPSTADRLHDLLAATDAPQLSLEALWALEGTHTIEGASFHVGLGHPDPHVRLWAVRLAADPGTAVAPDLFAKIVALARQDDHPEVIAQLAASAGRLPSAQATEVLAAIYTRDAFAADPYIPLQTWWATEAALTRDRQAVLDLFADSTLWSRPLVADHLVGRIGRRFLAEPSPANLAAAASLLDSAPTKTAALALARGMAEALVGTALDDVPPELNRALAALEQRFPDAPELAAFTLRLNRIADLDTARATLADTRTPLPRRLATLNTLAELGDAASLPAFLAIATGADHPLPLRHAATSALRYFADPAVPSAILTNFKNLPPDLQRTAVTVLAGRPDWAGALLDAIAAGSLDRNAVPHETLLVLQGGTDTALAARVKKLYGTLRQPEQAKAAKIAAVEKLLADQPDAGDATRGAAVFAATCAACHRFRDAGRDVAPDLTGYEMDNTDFLLTSIVDPNLGVREEFELTTITLRPPDPETPPTLLTGFLVGEPTPAAVSLKDLAGNTTTVARKNITDLSRAPVSVMPEGLLDALSEQQVLDLFAYLQNPAK